MPAIRLSQLGKVLLPLAAMSLTGCGTGCAYSAPPSNQALTEAMTTTAVPAQAVPDPGALRAAEPVREAEEVVRDPLFAITRLYAATSAGFEGIMFTGHVEVIGIRSECHGMTPIRWSKSRQVRGRRSYDDEPSVAVVDELMCLPVSPTNPPLELIGARVPIARVKLPEFLNGEEFSSPDPDDLQGAAASLYLPDENGGHLIGAFVLTGYLEHPETGQRQASTAAAVAALDVTSPRDEQRFPLTILSPEDTPVTVMVPAPVRRLTHDSAGQDDVGVPPEPSVYSTGLR